MANITLFAQAIGKQPKENIRKICWLKHTARYKWALSNLVVSLRLNTFTKIDLQKWLNEPFTLPPDTEILA